MIGAVVDLGNCLDLLVRDNLDLLRSAYENVEARTTAAGSPIPENGDLVHDVHRDKFLRKLD